jgi:hypothetical protein
MRVKIKHKAHRQARWLIRLLGLLFRLFPNYRVSTQKQGNSGLGLEA